MVLLFLDLLGVRSRWQEGGVAGALEAIYAFRGIVSAALKGARGVRTAAVESDSAAILCSTPRTAIVLGRRAFRAAFEETSDEGNHRYWLRGVILPALDTAPFRTERQLFQDRPGLTVAEYSPSLMEAIAAEKAGIKGMRLLIHAGLATARFTRTLAIKATDGGYSQIVKRLKHSVYPARLAEYEDILWMADAHPARRMSLGIEMNRRLRMSAADSEEFIHAAATQVVFNECYAIIGAVARSTATRRMSNSEA